MSITLTTEQETWIKARVATGDFASVEEAVRQLIDDRIAELADHEGDVPDDMAWAKPLVDEARAAIARGDVLTLEEHRARNAARRAARRASGRVCSSPIRRTSIPPRLSGSNSI
jgi:antitoxin ParD1/3/4